MGQNQYALINLFKIWGKKRGGGGGGGGERGSRGNIKPNVMGMFWHMHIMDS